MHLHDLNRCVNVLQLIVHNVSLCGKQICTKAVLILSRYQRTRSRKSNTRVSGAYAIRGLELAKVPIEVLLLHGYLKTNSGPTAAHLVLDLQI